MRTIAGSRPVVATIQPIERIKTNARRGTLADINASCIYCLMERSTEFLQGSDVTWLIIGGRKYTAPGTEAKQFLTRYPILVGKPDYLFFIRAINSFLLRCQKLKASRECSFDLVPRRRAPLLLISELTTWCVEDPALIGGKNETINRPSVDRFGTFLSSPSPIQYYLSWLVHEY